MSAIDAFVGEVLKRLPRCLPERARIEADLRSHLADRVDAGESETEAVSQMGTPEEVAREFLADIRLRPATLLRRGAAFLIDLALGLVVAMPLILISPLMGDHGMDERLRFLGVFLFVVFGGTAFLLAVAYFPLLEALFGQTAGKRAVGICVVRENGERVGWGAAIIRRIPFYFEFFLLDALFALFTKRRQRAFDMVARTIVVKVGG